MNPLGALVFLKKGRLFENLRINGHHNLYRFNLGGHGWYPGLDLELSTLYPFKYTIIKKLGKTVGLIH